MNNCNNNACLASSDNCSCDISLCSLSEAYKVCLLNVKNIELNKIFKLKELKPLYDYSVQIEKIINDFDFDMFNAANIPVCEGLKHDWLMLNNNSLYEKVSLFGANNINVHKECCYGNNDNLLQCVCGINFSYKVRVYSYSSQQDFNHPKFCCAEYENIKDFKMQINLS